MMKSQTYLHLLKELEDRYPAGFIRTQNVLVFELLSSTKMVEEFGAFLKGFWSTLENPVCFIDLDGIDFISPSAANALTEGVMEFIKDRKQSIVLINVRPEVLAGLQTARYVLDHRPTICAIDPQGGRHFIGDLPDRLREVLQSLEEMPYQDGVSASDLAEYSNTEVNKRNINRFSVYLQELHNLGLVYRRKVGGLARTDAERGWTYLYRPAYLDINLEIGG